MLFMQKNAWGMEHHNLIDVMIWKPQILRHSQDIACIWLSLNREFSVWIFPRALLCCAKIFWENLLVVRYCNFQMTYEQRTDLGPFSRGVEKTKNMEHSGKNTLN